MAEPELGEAVVKARVRQGRIIRRFRRNIPIKEFDQWSELIRGRAKGRGLYALYSGERLIYVGLATRSIRSRIYYHKQRGKIPFTHFAVFLVAGNSAVVQGRRIRDLEALLLHVIGPKPKWNKAVTKFVAARKLKVENISESKDRH